MGESSDRIQKRTIDLHEGDQLDKAALKALIREAVDLNISSARGSQPWRT